MGGHWEPISFLVQILDFLDLNWLVIGSAPSKKSRSAPEVFRAGHNRDMTDTGNRARKTSGTQGTLAYQNSVGWRGKRKCFSIKDYLTLFRGLSYIITEYFAAGGTCSVVALSVKLRKRELEDLNIWRTVPQLNEPCRAASRLQDGRLRF